MKKLLLIFAFLLSAEWCLASKDSVTTHVDTTVMLKDTTENDGWSDEWNSATWSLMPFPQDKPEKTKQEKKAERKQARREERENNPSNFPRGVAWSSVGIALIGLIKLAVQQCK